MKGVPVLLASVVLMAACTKSPEQSQRQQRMPSPNVQQPAEAVTAEMNDGVQIVEIKVGSSGYSPNRIALETGTPARLIFTRTADASCIEHVSIPAFGIEKTTLPLNEPKAIEIEPDRSGEFTFVCSMGMVEGALLVSDT